MQVFDSSLKKSTLNDMLQIVDTEEDNKSKKSKGCAEEEESKITEQHSNSSHNQKESNGNNNDKKNKENSGCTSKDNSKHDYIHVRARRGQATDSHSLAERVSKTLKPKLQNVFILISFKGEIINGVASN